MKDGTLLHTMSAHKGDQESRGYVNSVAFLPGGRILVSGGKDGNVHFWSVSHGRLRMTLLFLGSRLGEHYKGWYRALFPSENSTPAGWIACTPDGHYDASPDAAKLLRWRVGDKTVPAARFRKDFHRPHLMRSVLRGN